jgi:tellurite resistance-related uncharacterized protein
VLVCPLCDRAELPDRLKLTQRTPWWDENTMPPGLERPHRLAEGVWGQIKVHRGRLRFVTQGEVVIEVTIDPRSTHAIPPGLDHSIEALGSVCFSIDFFSIVRDDVEDPLERDLARLAMNQEAISSAFDDGGETAREAHRVCFVCGGILDDVAHSYIETEDRG